MTRDFFFSPEIVDKEHHYGRLLGDGEGNKGGLASSWLPHLPRGHRLLLMVPLFPVKASAAARPLECSCGVFLSLRSWREGCSRIPGEHRCGP